MKQSVVEWTTADFRVEVEQRQKMGPNGPLFLENGQPDLVPVTVIVFIHNGADGPEHLRLPFSEEAKQKLVQGLTGGIVLPGGNHGFKL